FGQSQLQFAGVPLAAGDFYRQEQQLGIDDAMSRCNYEAEQPWLNLERHANMVYGSPGGTTSTMSGGGNRMGSILGGGLTGLGLASQFAGAGGLGSLGLAGAAPWALGGMAIAGLLNR
ncbi:MAG: hypothetical protein AB2533_11610, partial [Candidatus Thiodiazotropha endolucinida]